MMGRRSFHFYIQKGLYNIAGLSHNRVCNLSNQIKFAHAYFYHGMNSMSIAKSPFRTAVPKVHFVIAAGFNP
ncbi:hypothetical protein PEPS_35030 (plasmid) [Persicobacter psychrovividus]|uniref:Uncharacterized protein n=1 Tax=Persicobacter psychrovividus TaxID=387638 RepID=A0ABN6LDC7_9BACT|nr:hypothetical protein PEPS_35030 [Persicobacter psychrovividus]